MKTNAAIVDLKGRAWQPFEVSGASGYVTYTPSEGEIHVPYGKDPVSRTIQAHELSHVRYTSKLWPDAALALKHLTDLSGTSARIVGYAEDMRITALAGRLDVKTLPAFGDKLDAPIITRWVESFVAAGVPEPRVQQAIRFILTEHTTVLDSIGLSLDTLQQRVNAERYIAHCSQHIKALLERDKSKDESKPSPSKSDDKSKSEPKSDKSDKSEPAPADDSDEPQPSDGDDGDDSEPGDDKSDDKSDSDDKSADDSGDDAAPEGDEPGEGDDEGEGDSEGDTSEGDADGGEEDSDTSGGTVGEGAGQPEGGAESSELPLDVDSLELPDIREAMLQSVPAPGDTQALIQSFQHTVENADWIPVKTIERKPLVRRAVQSRNRGRRLSETGVVLGSCYDAVAPNERRPFAAKRKGGVGGLTVVIDCSGSMRISESQLEQLLAKHPQGVVVTYSSQITRYGKGDAAVVRLIASHGRLAAQSDFRDPTAGGNGCDGPMLEWLSKQSGERVWVCDGMITGKRDHGIAHDPAALAAWCKAKRITRFGSLSAYLDSLT
jgi:hypothetical protein